jgi:hypothetical protein
LPSGQDGKVKKVLSCRIFFLTLVDMALTIEKTRARAIDT